MLKPQAQRFIRFYPQLSAFILSKPQILIFRFFFPCLPHGPNQPLNIFWVVSTQLPKHPKPHRPQHRADAVEQHIEKGRVTAGNEILVQFIKRPVAESEAETQGNIGRAGFSIQREASQPEVLHQAEDGNVQQVLPGRVQFSEHPKHALLHPAGNGGENEDQPHQQQGGRESPSHA